MLFHLLPSLGKELSFLPNLTSPFRLSLEDQHFNLEKGRLFYSLNSLPLLCAGGAEREREREALLLSEQPPSALCWWSRERERKGGSSTL
ncbi:UNVERIFIED_CONTAM: hypothetical protein FKN15_058782 [Acipenser sinensis]